MNHSFPRLLGLGLLTLAVSMAQSVHNGDLVIYGALNASTATSTRPFTTVTVDPTGTCSNAAQTVLNTSGGSQRGDLSACIGGAWTLIGGGGSLSVPSAGLVKSTGTAFATATAGVDYQTPLTIPIPVSLGGSGTASPSLVGGSGIQISGAWPNQTITNLGGGGGGSSGNATSIQGNVVKTGTPSSNGQGYFWNTSNNDFELGMIGNFLPTTGSGNFVESTQPSLISPSFGQSGPTLTYTSGGTIAANTLVSADNSGRAIQATTGGGSFGIAATSVSGIGNSVEIQTTGLGQCVMDGPAAIGHIAISSISVAGDCADSGVTSSTQIAPSTGIVGAIRTTTTTAGQLARIQIHGPGVFGTQSTGGGGGGASNASSLTDYAETSNPNGQTSASFYPGISFPFNNQTCSFSTNGSISITGSANDTLYIYADNTCRRTLGYGSANTYTLTGFENSTPINAVTSFPANSAPLEKCTIVAGKFSGPCTEQLNWLARTTFVSGVATTPNMTNNGLEVDVNYTPSLQAGTNYNIQATDQGRVLEFTSTAAVSAVLPQANNPAGSFAAGWWTIVSNPNSSGGNVVTLTPTLSTINGTTNLTIGDGQAYMIVSEGALKSANGTYIALPLGGSGGGGGTGATAPLSLSASLTNQSVLTLANTNASQYTIETWQGTGHSYQWGVGNASAAFNSNNFYALDATTQATILAYTPTNTTWTIPGNLTVSGTCTGCGGGGGSSNGYTVASGDALFTTNTTDTSASHVAASEVLTNSGGWKFLTWNSRNGGTLPGAMALQSAPNTGSSLESFMIDSGGDIFLGKDQTDNINGIVGKNSTMEFPITGGVLLTTTGTQPSCIAANRGMLWFIQAASGVADQMQVCGKTSGNTYAWSNLF